MTKFLYYLLYIILYTIALLPFWALYILSDILYPIIYYVARYRRKVVSANLENSFPLKTKKERLKIEKKFYRHFSDYFFETIKLLHVSSEAVQNRIKFNNLHLISEQLDAKGSIILMLGHYGNWEWVTSIGLGFHDRTKTAQIYRPLNNKAFNLIFLKIRSRFGSDNISKYKVLRAIVKMKKERERYIIGFISDQSPSVRNIHYWTQFLNQETPVFTGTERIAKQTDFAVLYLDVNKVGRGKYSCDIKLISDNPKNEKDFVITEKYVREMEKTIIREPSYWLWTHRRWKYKREDSTKDS